MSHEHFFQDKFAIPLLPRLTDLKNLHPREKFLLKDAGCAGKKITAVSSEPLLCRHILHIFDKV